MAADDPDLAAESWRFALQLYAAPGVADACLTLQARAGVDIMLLLVAGFAAARRRIRLEPADIAAMDALCRDWRTQVVQPLRTLRTKLKSGPSPAPSAVTEALRAQVKASELTAERLENDLLAGWLRCKSAGSAALGRDVIRDIVASVIHYFAAETPPGETDEVERAVDIVAGALHASAE